VTIVAKPVVTLLKTVINRPTVAIYLTWRTFNVLLAAPFKLWDPRPDQLAEIPVLVSLYSLGIIAIVARIVWAINRAASS
jgi:hypothetical protein